MDKQRHIKITSVLLYIWRALETSYTRLRAAITSLHRTAIFPEINYRKIHIRPVHYHHTIILRLRGVEMLLQILPALVIGGVQLLAGLLTPLGHRHAQGSLKHECLHKRRSRGCHWSVALKRYCSTQDLNITP